MNEIQVNYYISADANIRKSFEFDLVRNSIGNSFPTSEEAEKVVEKLRAWKRLRDKGFKFVGWEDTNNYLNDILFELPYMEWDKNVCDDLDLLFGGEK